MTSPSENTDPLQIASTRLLTITSIILFSVMACIRPRMPDGDGLSHAGRAIYLGFLEGMEPKHLISAAAMRCFYLPVEALGLRNYAIGAVSASSHLATIGTFLLLAGVVYPRFISDRLISFCCALGVVLSFGVLSRGCAIEVYALALMLDVALVAQCLVADFTRPTAAVMTGLLWALAIGAHMGNLLIGPFVFALSLRRVDRDRAWGVIGWAAVTVLVGMTSMWAMLLAGRDASIWPPDLAVVLPKGDPVPPLGFVGRLGRGVYGFLRTVAYLPAVWDLQVGLACVYAAALGAVSVMVLYLAWHGAPKSRARYGEAASMLALIVVPFVAFGLYYYPSDPERWLFLMPVLWLAIGVVWADYSPDPGSWLGRDRSRFSLVAIVLVLGVYNVALGMLPAALADRQLAGFRELARKTSPDDLVVTAAGVKGAILEFFIDEPFAFDNLKLIDLANEHASNQLAAQTELRSRITRRLRSGGRVFAHGLLGDPHSKVKGRGYPWAHIPDFDPELFLSVLREFSPEVVTPLGSNIVSTYRLRLTTASDSGPSPE